MNLKLLTKYLEQLAKIVILAIMFLVPFDGFITVWATSIIGHYTALRLWDDVLLVILVFITTYFVARTKSIRQLILKNKLFWLIIAYAALEVIWGIVAFAQHNVDAKALGFALVVNLRFLIFFLAVLIVAPRFAPGINWQRLVLIPAAAVILFGLAQITILPHNFLSHFGYGPNTIPAYETINHNQSYIRIQSTARGANPLGAYLLIPTCLLFVLALKRRLKDWRITLLLILSLICLFFSFSRGAWLGCAISLSIITVLLVAKTRRSIIWITSTGIVVLVLLSSLFVIFHNNARFQNVVFHTQNHSTVKATSDQGHASALKSGLDDLGKQPFGRGPGTAGPASVYNNHPARIAENYFIQVGQEVGWLGLALFLAINIVISYQLWQRRDQAIALVLLASLVGITLINMLSHAWTDDTLAYIWWGLAGLALASPITKSRRKLTDDN